MIIVNGMVGKASLEVKFKLRMKDELTSARYKWNIVPDRKQHL